MLPDVLTNYLGAVGTLWILAVFIGLILAFMGLGFLFLSSRAQGKAEYHWKVSERTTQILEESNGALPEETDGYK